MTANDDLGRRLSDHYVAEAPTRAPDWVLRSVLATIDTTNQRRVIVRPPWGFRIMNTYARLAAAAVAVVAVGAIGLAFLGGGRTPGTGGVASPIPSPSPSPSPSFSPSPQPALTEMFTSDLHGISVSYPAGWKVRPATEPWPWGGEVAQDTTYTDVIYKQEGDSPFIALASQPLAGRTLEEWIASWQPLWREPTCAPTQPISVDGAAGVIGDPCTWAGVVVDDRAYLIWLFRVDDRDWFEEILATVQIHPEDVVDASPGPSASPSPT